jgi:hypothetical protein
VSFDAGITHAWFQCYLKLNLVGNACLCFAVTSQTFQDKEACMAPFPSVGYA